PSRIDLMHWIEQDEVLHVGELLQVRRTEGVTRGRRWRGHRRPDGLLVGTRNDETLARHPLDQVVHTLLDGVRLSVVAPIQLGHDSIDGLRRLDESPYLGRDG